MATSDPAAALARFTVAAAPFPYVERPVRRRRPCLVVGLPPEATGLVWVLMITSATNAGWPGDVPVTALAEAGLRAESVVRTAKIATVEREVLVPIGRLTDTDAEAVARQLTGTLGARPAEAWRHG